MSRMTVDDLLFHFHDWRYRRIGVTRFRLCRTCKRFQFVTLGDSAWWKTRVHR